MNFHFNDIINFCVPPLRWTCSQQQLSIILFISLTKKFPRTSSVQFTAWADFLSVLPWLFICFLSHNFSLFSFLIMSFSPSLSFGLKSKPNFNNNSFQSFFFCVFHHSTNTSHWVVYFFLDFLDCCCQQNNKKNSERKRDSIEHVCLQSICDTQIASMCSFVLLLLFSSICHLPTRYSFFFSCVYPHLNSSNEKSMSRPSVVGMNDSGTK